MQIYTELVYLIKKQKKKPYPNLLLRRDRHSPKEKGLNYSAKASSQPPAKAIAVK